MNGKTDIKSLSTGELTAELNRLGIKGYRIGQINRWLKSGVTSFDKMGNIPKNDRETLCNNFYLTSAIINCKRVSADGTVKFLFELIDGEYVESVVMRYHHGISICISTQVGCAMGCAFCASTQNGLVRNLTASEMCDQIHTASADVGQRISNVVLMGMGEPLHNFDNTLRFIELAADPLGLGIGSRHISVSTCGLVDKMDELAKYKLGVTLSVSLHAPNDVIRSSFMPVNSRYGVDEVIAACKRYSDATGRRISIEYSLIDGVNNSDECARELALKLKGMLIHVNLIPVNDINSSRAFAAPAAAGTKRFLDLLLKGGINATVRRTLGSDIEASCGQLRAKKDSEK